MSENIKIMKKSNGETISPRLTEQQNAIINANDDKIVVEAGPGSGKTYTLTNKICHDIGQSNDSFIALSFTKEASAELVSRMEGKIDTSALTESFIGTIDSFLLSFIKTYSVVIDANQENNEKNQDSDKESRQIDWNKVDIVYETRYRYTDWLDVLYTYNVYQMCGLEYKTGLKMLDEKSIFDFYSGKYSHIYIDEAQDLNRVQFSFVEKFASVFNLKIMYIGDSDQTLYAFRGACPSYFSELSERGFVKYTIAETVRCPEEIKLFAENYLSSISHYSYNNDLPKKYKHISLRESVILGDEYNEKTRQTITIYGPMNYDKKFVENNDCLMLGDTNRSCEWMQKVATANNVNNLYYVYPLSIENLKIRSLSESDLNKLEDVLKYYLNPEKRCVYKQLLNDMEDSHIEMIDKCHNLNDVLEIVQQSKFISIEPHHIDRISEKVQENCHYYYYKKDSNINRIMTIHQSKGLEADYVFVNVGFFMTKDDDSTRRQYYVAFTRAKKHLFIDALARDIPRLKHLANKANVECNN